MLRLLDAPVTPDEIDHLGHMNVRHYSRRAWRAAEAYFARQGLDDAALAARGLALIPRDLFAHYYREQREGDPLVVDGAATKVNGEPRLYVEILNARSGERAAAFIVEPALTSRVERAPAAGDLPWDLEPGIPLPAHVAPRTLSFVPPRRDVTMAELQRRCGGWEVPDQIGETRVPASACDETGAMILWAAQDIDFLIIDAVGAQKGHLLVEDDHPTYGWAVLENRQFLQSVPRAGDRVLRFSAELRVERKAHWTRRWTFNGDTGALFGIVDTVALAFDPAVRRAIEIPPRARKALEAQALPDLI